MVCKYFLTFCRFPFILILLCRKAFYFDVVPLVYFLFYCLCFWCHILKITLPKPFSRSVFSKFNSSSFMLSGLPLKSLIHLKLLLWVVKIGVLFHSFACEFVVFLTLFIEKTILLHWVFLAPLSNISWPCMHEFILFYNKGRPCYLQKDLQLWTDVPKVETLL